jgi:hypothetical protein
MRWEMVWAGLGSCVSCCCGCCFFRKTGTNRSAPPSAMLLALVYWCIGGLLYYSYRNGRPHLRRGLEAQAPHRLLGAEDGGGALPEHVEGTSRLHCVCVCECVEQRGECFRESIGMALAL